MAVTVLAVVATFTVVAPVLLRTMFPECGEPETGAVGRRRTYIVVLEIVPEPPTVIGDPFVPVLAEKSLVVETW